MEDKEKQEVDFHEALRRIANAPKSVVPDNNLIMPEKVGYNKQNRAARNKPPNPAKRRI
jgi:hypothetical protein